MLFWLFAGLMTIVTALVVALPILRQHKGSQQDATSDLAVYRDQLKELDAEVARGILSASEAETSRTEISRRLLAADARQKSQAPPVSHAKSHGVKLGLFATLIVGAPLLYNAIGSPDVPDQPLSERTLKLTQAEAELQIAESGTQIARDLEAREQELLTRLQTALLERPDDLRGHRLLVQTLSSIGDFAGASAAQSDVIRILGENASADDYVEAAELMIFAAGGYVSPEANQSLAQALQLHPTDQRARYYSGVSMAQDGKPELAMRLWATLLSEGPADAPWKEPVRAQMLALSSSTGLPMPGQELRGPTQEEIKNASEMSDLERQDMIRGMVEGLSNRLANEGGTPEEWARLIRALGVLGDTDQAQAIYKEAQTTFAENRDGLATIADAARGLNLN